MKCAGGYLAYLNQPHSSNYWNKTTCEGLKLPNILLFCMNQNASSINSAKSKLQCCLGRNNYDVKHLQNIDDFHNTPWEHNIKALVLWCNGLSLDDDKETLSGIKTKVNDYLCSGGKVIVFGRVFTAVYFGNILSDVDIFKHFDEQTSVFLTSDSELLSLSSSSLKTALIDHKGGFFKTKETFCFATNLQYPSFDASLSACLLPLLDSASLASSGCGDDKVVLALSLLLESVGLSTTTLQTQEEQVNLKFGLLYCNSAFYRGVFKDGVGYSREPGVELCLQDEESYEDFKRNFSPGKNYTVVCSNARGLLEPAKFDWETYLKHLDTEAMGRLLIYFDVVSTTMSVLKGVETSFEKCLPTLVVANQQSGGKGRGGNIWLSPEGCAMFTLTIKFSILSNLGSKPPIIQHLMTVSLVHAIRSIPGLEDLDLGVKWPNDIYFAKNVKMGGILVESSIFKDSFIFRIGCGFNVANSKPMISLNQILKDRNFREPLTREEVIARTLSTFERLFDSFQKDGDKLFLKLYYKYWLHQNAEVTFTVDKKLHCGSIVGIDEHGYLSVRDLSTNRIITLHPDGNSFDIMKNLIHPKT